MNNPNEKPSDRIEAAKTLCIAETNIFKIVNEGPIFRVSLPIFPKDKELTDNNNNKQLT